MQRLGPLVPGSRLRPHLALPAPGTAGVTIPHPHAREGVVGDLPLVPDAEDPAVGVPAEGLLVLGHVVEWAELVLVPGDTGGMRGVPKLRPSPPSHPPALTWTPPG